MNIIRVSSELYYKIWAKKVTFCEIKNGTFFSQNVPFCAKKCPLSKIYQKAPYNTQFENVPKKLTVFKMRLIIPIKRALFRKWDPKKKVPFLKTEKIQITPYNPKIWKNWGPFLRYHFGKKGTIFGYFVVCTPGKTRPHFEKKRSLFWGKKGTDSHVRKSWRDYLN